MDSQNRLRASCVALAAIAATTFAPHAAQAANLEPQQVAPLPAGFNPGYLPQVRTGAGLIRPDGTVAWPIGADETTVYGRGIWMQALDVLSASPRWTTTLAKGSEQLGPGFYYPTLAAYRGSDWFVSQPERAPQATETNLIPATPTLIAFDDRGTVTKRVELPVRGKHAVATGLLPTARGLRVVMRGIREGENRVYLANERGRVRATLPPIREMLSAAALADGSLIVAGWSSGTHTEKLPVTVLRVSPSGRVARVDASQRRQPLRGLHGMVPAFGGAVTTTGLDGPNARVHLIRGTRTVKSVPAALLKFPRSAACLASPDHWILLGGVLAGPSGQPIVQASCAEEGDRGPRILQRVVLGLDRSLRVRWYADAAPFTPTLVGPDGRMLQIGASGVMAAAEPGARAPRRGTLLRLTRAGDGTATATIRCAAPTGTVCNGRIVIRRGGNTVASTIYAAPGRPGAIASTIRRTIDLGLAGSGRITARLEPLEPRA